MNIAATPHKRIIRRRACAAKLGVCESTLQKWTYPKSPIYKPDFPTKVKLGRTSGFFEHEVDVWLERQAAKTRRAAA